jgi:hypothetical protein
VEAARLVVEAVRLVVEPAARTAVRGRTLTGVVRDCTVPRLTVAFLATAFRAGARLTAGLVAVRLTVVLAGARFALAFLIVVVATARLTPRRAAVVLAAVLFAVRFLTGAFFAVVLVAAGFLVTARVSVTSSIDLIAVWIDLIAFIAVRLLAYATDLAIAAPFPATMSKRYLPPRLRSTNLVGIAASLQTESAGGRS